jgi:hypothetical protein
MRSEVDAELGAHTPALFRLAAAGRPRVAAGADLPLGELDPTCGTAAVLDDPGVEAVEVVVQGLGQAGVEDDRKLQAGEEADVLGAFGESVWPPLGGGRDDHEAMRHPKAEPTVAGDRLEDRPDAVQAVREVLVGFLGVHQRSVARRAVELRPVETPHPSRWSRSAARSAPQLIARSSGRPLQRPPVRDY